MGLAQLHAELGAGQVRVGGPDIRDYDIARIRRLMHRLFWDEFGWRAHRTFFLIFRAGRGRETLHQREQSGAVLSGVWTVRAYDGLVQVLLVTVGHEATGQLYGQVPQFGAVHGIRQITDAVNLGKRLIGQVHIVELGRGGIAAVEGFVGTGDGGHGVCVWWRY